MAAELAETTDRWPYSTIGYVIFDPCAGPSSGHRPSGNELEAPFPNIPAEIGASGDWTDFFNGVLPYRTWHICGSSDPRKALRLRTPYA
jgi:hypothetical protein